MAWRNCDWICGDQHCFMRASLSGLQQQAGPPSIEECKICGRIASCARWGEFYEADEPHPGELPEPRCGDCRFFVVSSNREGDLYGTCHRFPPQIGEENEAVYPYMMGNRDDAWCGEFQAKAKP